MMFGPPEELPPPPEPSNAQRVAIYVGAGVACLSTVVFFAGRAGGWDPWPAVVLPWIVGGLIIAGPYIALSLKEIRSIQAVRESRWREEADAQRAARNQSAASGGRVSSADAGRPPQGSSDATTDP